MKRNRQTVPVVGALLGLLLLSCGGASAPLAPAKRGDVVRIRRTATCTAAQVAALIAPLDAQAATLVHHEVRTYAIVYGTLDHRGQVVEASGSIMIPSTQIAVPMVSLRRGASSAPMSTGGPPTPRSFSRPTTRSTRGVRSATSSRRPTRG